MRMLAVVGVGILNLGSATLVVLLSLAELPDSQLPGLPAQF